MSKQIPLTQGCVTLISDCDYDWLMQWKWYVAVRRGGPAAVRNSLRGEGGKRRTIYMSRQIIRAPTGTYVDHANHQTLDNRRANLRVCTNAQNVANQRKQAGCSSRFKGVHRNEQRGKWQASIRASGKPTHLGLFTDELDAARAYNAAAIEEFGMFALLNEV